MNGTPSESRGFAIRRYVQCATDECDGAVWNKYFEVYKDFSVVLIGFCENCGIVTRAVITGDQLFKWAEESEIHETRERLPEMENLESFTAFMEEIGFPDPEFPDA